VSSPQIKNIPLVTSGKSLAHLRASWPTRGALRDRHETLGWGCDGRFGVRRGSIISERVVLQRRTKRRGVRPSRVVLTPVAGAKLARTFPAGDGDKTNSLAGESTKYAVKPLRGESRAVSAEPVCSCASTMRTFAHETAGAVGTRLSLRPLFRGGPTNLQKLGHVLSRERERTLSPRRPGQASVASADPGPIRRGGSCMKILVDGFASTTDGGYGSLRRERNCAPRQGRRRSFAASATPASAAPRQKIRPCPCAAASSTSPPPNAARPRQNPPPCPTARSLSLPAAPP
jgi:hypothetical protein